MPVLYPVGIGSFGSQEWTLQGNTIW
jgi:hypothetical protein